MSKRKPGARTEAEWQAVARRESERAEEDVTPFDDMEDDLPWTAKGAGSDAPSVRAGQCQHKVWSAGKCRNCGVPYSEEARIAGNRLSNIRKYKPQRGRMKLLMCVLCGWKCRTTASMIDAGIPGCPRPSCGDYQKPLERMD